MKTFAVGVAVLIALALAWPTAAEAQTRGRFHGRGRSVVVVRGFYPGFYGFSPFAFGYAPYAFAPYGYAPYAYGPFYGRTYEEASARVQVKPKQTEVYVDGYLAGVADDFDGTFQRLHVRPGGHEITLYLDGHRSVIERIYFSPGKTQNIKAAMVPLAPGEAPAVRPVPPPSRRQRQS